MHWYNVTTRTTDAQRRNSLHCIAENSIPIPNLLGMAEAYFVCHIGPIFQMSLIWLKDISTPDISTMSFPTPDFSTMNFSTPDFSTLDFPTPNLGLKNPGLKCPLIVWDWSLGLKSPGLKGMGLKLGVEMSEVEMSFNRSNRAIHRGWKGPFNSFSNFLK